MIFSSGKNEGKSVVFCASYLHSCVLILLSLTVLQSAVLLEGMEQEKPGKGQGRMTNRQIFMSSGLLLLLGLGKVSGERAALGNMNATYQVSRPVDRR